MTIQRKPSDGAPAPAAALTLERHDTISAIEAEWRHLEATGVGTLFQRFDWVDAWLTHVAPHAGLSPSLLLGRLDGAPAFALPLGIRASAGVKIVEFLGGTHAGYNFGLWSVEGAAHVAALPRATLTRLLGEALAADCAVLRRVPAAHDGMPQPLAALSALPSPVSGYSASLEGGMEGLLARSSGGARRRRANQKERRLCEMGVLQLGPTTAADAALDFFAEHKAQRLTEQGLHNVFAEPGTMDFLRELARRSAATAEPLLEMSTLDVDGRTRAVIGSGFHRGRAALQILTYAHDETLPHSPGQLLMYRHIEHCADAGCATFDFGIGSEGYKDAWSDTVHPLFDHHVAFTARGALAIAAMRFAEGAKARLRGNALARRLLGKSDAGKAQDRSKGQDRGKEQDGE